MLMCTKFDWIWPAGSGEEDFFIFFSAFLLFHYYLPLEKGYPLHLNKIESPLPKNDLCQVWLKLAQWFWRRRFFYFLQCIFTLSLLSPLGEGLSPSFE
jgi:hypothetical protein